MIDEQSSASGHDAASDRSAIGAGVDDCQLDRPISDTHNVHFRDGHRLISLVVNLLNCQIMQTVLNLTHTINECQ